ncbi:MAG TPA: TrkA C-terminal domain-containing protein [Verrucomicrobiae bacterium]
MFWLAFGVLVLAPLIALWRNVEALAMICAESAAQGRAKQAVLQPLFEKLLKGAASLGIVLWLAVLIPFAAFPWWGLVLLVAACVILAVVFWRKLIRLQSRFELELRTHLADSPFTDGRLVLAGLTQSNGRWELNLAECTIAENSRAVAQPIAGLPLRELFSCTIVSIERQDIAIPNPGADTVLFPNDKILLLGHDENLRRAESWLHAEAEAAAAKSEAPKLAEVGLEHLSVPATSRHVGKPLGELALNSLFGIQIVGIERDHRPVLGPGRSESLQPGDQLLVLGTPGQVNEMAFWLSTRPRPELRPQASTIER